MNAQTLPKANAILASDAEQEISTTNTCVSKDSLTPKGAGTSELADRELSGQLRPFLTKLANLLEKSFQVASYG